MCELMKREILSSVDRREDNVINKEVTVEGFFGDIIEDIGGGVTEGLVFLKHLATLDLMKYFEDKHRSDIYNDVMQARRYLANNIEKIDFESVRREEVHVPTGFAFRQKLLIDIIADNLNDVKTLTGGLLEEFNLELGKIISSEKYRNGSEVIPEMQATLAKIKGKKNEAIQDIDERIVGLMTSNSKQVLDRLTHSKEELFDNVKTIAEQLKIGDELELKSILMSVNSLTNRIKVYEKLEKEGKISKDISVVFDEIVNTLANAITVSAKLHHGLYTTAEVNVAITLEYLK